MTKEVVKQKPQPSFTIYKEQLGNLFYVKSSYGRLPPSLQGKFTSPSKAQKFINNYLSTKV